MSRCSLTARNITVEQADRVVLAGVDVTLTDQSRMAVVGPNGVGKTTLLKVLAGDIEPDAGSVEPAPLTTAVGIVGQELDRSTTTARSLLADRTGVSSAEAELTRSAAALAEGLAEADSRYDGALARWTQLGAADFEERLEAVAADLGLSRQALDMPTSALSGGQAARVGLAAVMLSRYDITLLDEPTNDLDFAGLERLERWVAQHEGGLVVVSHDRAFLANCVTAVLEIDEHSHAAALYQGGWEAYLTERSTARAHHEERYGDYVTERDRLARRAQQQREWAARGASRARKKPADRDKFIRAYNMAQTEKLAGKAKATERAIERLDIVDRPWVGWDLRFTIDQAARSGAIVASLDNAVIHRGDFELGPIDLEIRWADRVALTGPNGCGKSTLIEALLGRLTLDEGEARLGRSVVVGELDQRRLLLDRTGVPLGPMFEELSGTTITEARSVLAKFGLDSHAVARPAASLSPGERTRAQLALFQATGVNFLVLDEPTNHLDLPAIEQLESALEAYEGTLLLVSHDRRLLEAVTLTHTIDLT